MKQKATQQRGSKVKVGTLKRELKFIDLWCDKKEQKAQIITTDPIGYLEVYF